MSTSSTTCIFCAQTVESSSKEKDKCHNKKSQLTNQQNYCLKQMLVHLAGGETKSEYPTSKIINKVLKLWTLSSNLKNASGDFIITQLCNECNVKVQKFVTLQLELEYIWRKITNLVKNMQGLIVSSKLKSADFTGDNTQDTINQFQSAVLCAVNTVNLKASWNLVEAFATQPQSQPEPSKIPDVTVEESDEDVVSLNNSADFGDNDDTQNSVDCTSLRDDDNNDNYVTSDVTIPPKIGNEVIPIQNIEPVLPLVTRRYCCGQCQDGEEDHLAFETESELRQHIAEEHTKQIFKCQYCQKVFNKNITRQQHHKLHTGEAFKCEKCGKQFAYKSQWQKHVKYMHLEEKKFACKICGKFFRCPYSLTEHQSTHNDERSYECKLCSRKLKTESTFRSHMLTHTALRNIACGICRLKFTSKAAVKGHQKRMHPDNNQNN